MEYRTRWRYTLLIFGPIDPPAVYDAPWLKASIDCFLCNPLYGLDYTSFGSGERYASPNPILALLEDVDKLRPRRHLLFILDDVEQAPDSVELESMLLEPLTRYYGEHNFSLLLAFRGDIHFDTVEALRRPSRFERLLISPFTGQQSYAQNTNTDTSGIRQADWSWRHRHPCRDPFGFAEQLHVGHPCVQRRTHPGRHTQVERTTVSMDGRGT